MAQRIATEYVNASLQLTDEEMAEFIRCFEDQHVKLQVRVLDNGNHEMVLEDDAGREEVRLTFERQQDSYVCVLSCRIDASQADECDAQSGIGFPGDAIVNRIYPNYTMIYHYIQGDVHKIVEHQEDEARVVFEYKDTIGQLEAAFRITDVEHEIEVHARCDQSAA